MLPYEYMSLYIILIFTWRNTVTAAILYSCESWLNVGLKKIETLYMSALKTLLRVRTITANDLCLIELGYPPLKDLVMQKQAQFFQRMVNERQSLQDDPLIFATTCKLTTSSGTSTGTYPNPLLFLLMLLRHALQHRLYLVICSDMYLCLCHLMCELNCKY